ncbi:hypothetical protein [Bacillus sp. FJAT-26390]|uniref:hypothetical protein n=1 Tax=Bacillus sp. FJAT-26390 TaxID=1743142 RepID=UPI000807D0CD|nr:hypothetical protein [Bacillus sp. FJAT-26390]OBZ13308.1 hypothetical protein A7975_10645 [Bacillus sp. FJAT-26390]
MKRYVGIDPASTTGFVALDERGNVMKQKDLTGVGDIDPKRMETLIQEIMDHLLPDDVICIESPATNAIGQGVGFMWGLAYGIRGALYRRNIKFHDVAPTALKKFCDGSRHRKGADGKKMDSKATVAAGVYEIWGYHHASNNVTDAYVLAQIAYATTVTQYELEHNFTDYQYEVVKTVLKPMVEKKADKAAAKKKAKEKAIAKALGTTPARKPRSRTEKPTVGVLF